jgi:hypothetical protein
MATSASTLEEPDGPPFSSLDLPSHLSTFDQSRLWHHNWNKMLAFSYHRLHEYGQSGFSAKSFFNLSAQS